MAQPLREMEERRQDIHALTWVRIFPAHSHLLP